MLTQWHMHAHILNVMVVVIVSDIVGNEEKLHSQNRWSTSQPYH